MNYKEKVTVCIPTHNRQNSIGNTIKSILNQSYKNIDILIVDNASTDNTREVVKSFGDERIKYVYFDELLGVNYNFMRAISLSETDIVCVFHSDDVYFENIVQEQLRFIIDPRVGAVFSKMILRHEGIDCLEMDSSNYVYSDFEVDNYDHKSFFNKSLSYGIPVACPTFMTKKTVIEEVGLLNKKEGLISDLSLWLPISRSYNIVNLQKPLMYYILSKNQLSYKIHHKRMVESPQFKVLDNELSKYRYLATKRAIIKFKIRKFRDYMSISLNSFRSRKPNLGFRYFFSGIRIFFVFMPQNKS